MKMPCIQALVLLCLILVAGGQPSRAADESDPATPTNRPNRAILKERAKNLSPEERQKLIREFREKHGLAGTNRSEWESRREELKKLPPAEREARLKEFRQEIQEGRRQFKLLAPEEREAKRREMKQRIDARIDALKKSKTEGSLSDIEQRRLERMEQMSERLGRGENPRRPIERKKPAGQEGEALPPPKPASTPPADR